MENTHNVAKGSSGSHTTLDVKNLAELLSGVVETPREAGQPEGFYTTMQIAEMLNVGKQKAQNIVKEACISGVLKIEFVKWMDWDGCSRTHRCFRVAIDD